MTAIQWQSYGIILTFTLLCEKISYNKSKPMSWSFLSLALHTAAELFLVGVERLPLLEQIKTRKGEIAVDVIGGGVGNCGLLVSIRLCRSVARV